MLDLNKLKDKLKLGKVCTFMKKIKAAISKFNTGIVKPAFKKVVQPIKRIFKPVFIKASKTVGNSKFGKQMGKAFAFLGNKLKPIKKRFVFLDKLDRAVMKKNRDYIIAGLVAVAVVAGSIFYIANYRAISLKNKINQCVITENNAEAYFYQGDYAKAIKEYINISNKDNGNPKWDVHIAEVYSVKGDVQNSRTYLQTAKNKIANDNIKDGDLLNYLVFTEFMNKDYDTALKDGEKALKDAPKNKSLIKTMFTVYMANNQIDKAKAIISTYPVDSKSAYDMTEYARMLMIINDWGQGLQILRNAWGINKDELKVYDVLAQISVYNSDLILEKVSDLAAKNPNDLAYKMWLAKIYSLSDATADQAAAILDQIKNEDTGKVEIKLIQVAVYQNSQKPAEADKLMTEIIQNNSSDYRILHEAGWYYLNKKDYDQAMLYCKESIVKNKNYPDNYGFLMPDILQAQGKSLEGEPYFRTALLKEPYNYNIMLKLANYYWNTTQNTDKALEYFQFAEIVKPNDPEIKYNMACIYLAKKQEAQAIDLLKQCIQLDDMTSKYHRTLGTIYLTEKKYTEGIQQIKYAYKADESDIEALNNAGAYYISVDGNIEKGLINFQAATDGITSKTDKYTSDTIKQNYQKAKNLYDKYKNGKGNETLKVPDFTLFY